MKRRGFLSLMASWMKVVVFSLAIFALLLSVDCRSNETATTTSTTTTAKTPQNSSGSYETFPKSRADANRARRKRCAGFLTDFWQRTKTQAKSLLTYLVPKGIRNMFSSKDDESDGETTSSAPAAKKMSDEADNKEHGNLDFIGRDIIRGISSTASKVSKKLGFTSSNSSAGLDANKTFFSGVSDNFKEHVQAIYPGTLWCGGGNKAKNYEDLGLYNDTDACCRDHDECPENMASGVVKHGLMNTGLFTRSHCDCDKKFYDCLKATDSVISNKIGFTYFTILGPQCYKHDDKIVDCAREKSGRCVEYKTEKSQQAEKIYQWFDNPTY